MSDHSPRKKPQQARSRATYDAIIEATAQILTAEGYPALTTNYIAERAGVSVGSLYQYFPNKEAVIAAMVEQFAEEQFDVLAEELADVEDAPIEEAVRRLIRATLRAKKLQPELSRVIFDQLPPVGQVDVWRDWSKRAHRIVHAALLTRADDVRPDNLDMAAFLLIYATHGVIHGTVVERPELLDDEEFVDETAELVLRYLR